MSFEKKRICLRDCQERINRYNNELNQLRESLENEKADLRRHTERFEQRIILLRNIRLRRVIRNPEIHYSDLPLQRRASHEQERNLWWALNEDIPVYEDFKRKISKMEGDIKSLQNIIIRVETYIALLEDP